MLPLVAGSVLLGALAQRITGMGFALVAAPALVLLLGPFDGVMVANAGGLISSLIILPRLRRDIEWRRYAVLIVPAVVGSVAGALVAVRLPGTVLQVGIGLLVIAALTVSLVVVRTDHVATGTPPALIAGVASGFMSATAGVGGPAVSVYAVATRWPQRAFAATAQPYFATLASVSLVGKLAADGWRAPGLDATAWAVVLGCLVLGLIGGEALSRVVPTRVARAGVIVIAYVDGAAAVVDGLLG